MPDIEITNETVEAYLNGSLTDMGLREEARRAFIANPHAGGLDSIRVGLAAAAPLIAARVARELLDAMDLLATHAAMEGCDRCCRDQEVRDVRNCPDVLRWRATVAEHRRRADELERGSGRG